MTLTQEGAERLVAHVKLLRLAEDIQRWGEQLKPLFKHEETVLDCLDALLNLADEIDEWLGKEPEP